MAASRGRSGTSHSLTCGDAIAGAPVVGRRWEYRAEPNRPGRPSSYIGVNTATRGDTVAQWKALPGELPPEIRHLTEQLRLLKDRSGLSLVALQDQTTYSKSSWQRYLNGQKVPPRQAVLALGAVAGADPRRLAALWELAAASRHRPDGIRGERDGERDGEADGEKDGERSPVEAPAPSRPRRHRWRVAALLTGGLALAAAGGVAASAARSEVGKTCQGQECSNREPAEYGCTDGKKRLAQGTTHGVRLRIWYSARCRATWGEMETGAVVDSLTIESDFARAATRPAQDDTDSTRMVASGSPQAVDLRAELNGGVVYLLGHGEHGFTPDAMAEQQPGDDPDDEPSVGAEEDGWTETRR
ncbi:MULTISPECIES: helix-turn-helix domain-containing protein [unclassified Streptomyces]|uniref:helix-turn-helix domain-containing protein n=1 Tax=unclassified Streptomyces TaxID=2593676 RepID=UPI00336A84AB